MTDHVYFRGGASSRGQQQTCVTGEVYPRGKLWRYDFAAHLWTDLNPANPADYNFNDNWELNRWLALDNTHRKFLTVGPDRWGGNTDVVSYDIASNTWSIYHTCVMGVGSCPDMFHNAPEEGQSAPIVYDELAGKIILKLNNGTYRFDYATKTWSKSTSAREPFAHPYIGFVYVKAWGVSILMGAGSSYNETWAYNAATDTWTQKAAFHQRCQYGGFYGEFSYDYSTKDNVIATWGNDNCPGFGTPFPVWVYRYMDVGSGGDTVAPGPPTNLNILQ